MKTLAVYASKHGFSKTCLEALQEKVKTKIDIINLKEAKNPDISGYDTIIIGGGIYAGSIVKEVKDFVSANESVLLTKNIILFTTSGSYDDRYFDDNFPLQIVAKAELKLQLGASIIKKTLSIPEKLVLMLVGKYKEYSKINEASILKIADLLNNRG